MSLYEELTQVDILRPVIGLLKSGKFNMDWDGKIRLKETVPFERYWLTNVFCPDRMCHIWIPVYFQRYKFIPKGCRNCWKVVLQPKTLRELMKVRKVQLQGGIPSKCGLELRPYTGNVGGYGAYWYAPLEGGLEGGRELFVKLTQEFPDKTLILKRGCTEMEAMFYPSSSWDNHAQQWNLLETLLNTTYEGTSKRPTKEPGAYITYTLMQWIEWAFEHGDETYRDYTDRSFKMEYELYNHKGVKNNNHKIEDFRSDYEPSSNRSECGTSEEESKGEALSREANSHIQRIS